MDKITFKREWRHIDKHRHQLVISGATLMCPAVIGGCGLSEYRANQFWYRSAKFGGYADCLEDAKSIFGHKCVKGYYNSGFYHQGAIGREGAYCLKCNKIEWTENSANFFDSLPIWLQNYLINEQINNYNKDYAIGTNKS